MPTPTPQSKPAVPATDVAPAGRSTQAVGGAGVARTRPPGELGGHTVQEWEQPAARTSAKPGSSSRDTPAPQPGGEDAVALDAAPAVTPIYLRPARKASTSAAVPGVVAPEAPALAPGNQALVDAITLSLSDMLARGLPEAVASALRMLQPEIAAPAAPATPAQPAAESAPIVARAAAQRAPTAQQA